jgi:predicted deacylase
MPPLVGYDMNDSDAGKVSQEAARIFGVSTIWGHPGEPPPGRTISEAHSRAIPWLYVESSGGGRIRTDELQYYTSGLLNLLRFLQIINGIPARQPIKFHLIGNGDIDSAVTAKTAGFFTPTVGILDYVLPGHRVGLVRDMFGDTIEEIVAPNEGNVVLLRALPIVRPGDTLCVITGGSGIDTH